MARETRRDFLRKAGTAVVASAALGQGHRAGAQADRKPSVLIVMCDQLTASCLGCYGGRVPTPNIDRIAREGVTFDQATCPTPFCSPSRASLINGLYPHTHGIVANCGAKQTGIGPEDVTTERILSEAGYPTHFYGKWHLIPPPVPYYADMYRPADYEKEMAEVFRRVRAERPEGFMPFYNWALPVDVDPEFQKAVDGLGDKWQEQRFAGFITKMGRLRFALEDHYDVRVAGLTVERLRALGDRPSMVTCSFIAPHDPNVALSPYYEQFPPGDIALPANWQAVEDYFDGQWSRTIIKDLGEAGLREFLRVFYAMVAMIDDQVGRILEALEAAGRADDTVLVFTADHGDMMGGHGMVWKSTNAFFEEVARIPFIIHYPRRVRPRRSQIEASLVDVMPTILDLLGRPIPEGVQGQSLAPFLTGERDDSEARPYSFSERIRPHPEAKREVAPGTPGSFMIRGGGWKYVRYPNREFLYHLADDPGETANLAENPDHADKQAELSAALDEWLKETGHAKAD